MMIFLLLFFLESQFADKEKQKDILKSIEGLTPYFHYSYEADMQNFYEDFEKIYLDVVIYDF
jgi:hypothetical protein